MMLDLNPPSSFWCPDWVVEMRLAPGASVCVDEACELSGGFAHVGECEPCSCGYEHAIAECPASRDAAKGSTP